MLYEKNAWDDMVKPYSSQDQFHNTQQFKPIYDIVWLLLF